MLKILSDAAARPKPFMWFGALTADVVAEWQRARELFLPDDLVELLIATGGGDAFETETILGLLAGHQLGDDADSVNAWHRARGLPAGLWVFQQGAFLSATRTSDGAYVTLDNATYAVTSEYGSLDAWYLATLRREYAERYGLPS